MLRYLTAGESHGRALVAILEGMPLGLKLDIKAIDTELARRQAGYGRGKRMQMERDRVEILAGLREGKTMGSPIALVIKNKDYRLDQLPPLTGPRPGHADLAGAIKYDQPDFRDILERASARETAARVAVGGISKQLLSEFAIDMLSHVISIGGIRAHTADLDFNQIRSKSSKSVLNCADKAAEKLMIAEIDKMKERKDTLGGVFEIIVISAPVGLGSHVHYDRKADGRLCGALASIQGIKGVEVGLGIDAAKRAGSEVHDEIFYEADKGFFRNTNNAGGIEGGMTNGEPIILRAAMKPISTLGSPLSSVDLGTKKSTKASVERADICAVSAAGVVGEAVVAFELANLMIEKFGGDSILEMKRNYEGYLQQIKEF